MITKAELREILKHKYYNENLLKYHNETAITTSYSLAPGAIGTGDKVGRKAIALADAKYEMMVITVTLNLCNATQKDFVALRFFEDNDIKDITGLMCCSKTKLYRMEDEILNMTLDIINSK